MPPRSPVALLAMFLAARLEHEESEQVRVHQAHFASGDGRMGADEQAVVGFLVSPSVNGDGRDAGGQYR